jgi:lipopolysaccharide/colanic/teichoic acid biosynthesis glycosyltransferase
MARIDHAPGHVFFVRPLPAWKRTADLLVAGIALVCVSPLLLALAILILAVSPGPVLFGQRRVGHGGKEFTMWKFRSMHVNTDTGAHERAATQEIAANGTLAKVEDRTQLIPCGGYLRRSCLDELPQLFNVLRGEMSIVGPRPEPVYAARHYETWHRLRLDVLPGMTGLWQVSGKNRTTFREMLLLDIRYTRHQSPALDLWILLKTPGVIVAEIMDGLRATGSPRPACPPQQKDPPQRAVGRSAAPR